MAQPYSQDLRDRVLAACGRAMKTKQVAEVFAVSASWVRRVKQRLREHGEVSPRACTPTARFIKIDRVKLRELVETHPDATLAELRQLLGVRCAESSIWRALNRMGYSFKKRRFTRPSRIDRMSPGNARHGSTSSPNSTPAA
jgi:transposase